MEHYKGIKFAVRFAEKKLLDFPIQKELIAWGEKLSKLDCIPTYPHPENPHIISSAGNLSARIDGKFIITSAGSNLGALTQKNFVEIIDVDVHTQTIQAIGIEQPLLKQCFIIAFTKDEMISRSYFTDIIRFCSRNALK